MTGRVTYEIEPSSYNHSARLDALDLDAVRMKIDAVSTASSADATDDAWSPSAFEYDDKRLRIPFATALTAGRSLAVRIDYRVTSPPLGLHFVNAGLFGSGKTVAIYSMAEPLQARYWIPCHDWPDTRWPSDTFITVPRPLVAVAVGEPINTPSPATEPAGEPVTYHWRQSIPIDPHMFGFAVGEFTEIRDDSTARPPVSIFCHVRYAERARYSLRRSRDMIDFYSKLLGVEYPWTRFSHVLVEDHFHGGMEHVGFDMVAPSLLVTSSAGQESLSPVEFNYIAHMIGHQWFGGLANYQRITEAWLNEGFATYLHQNWQSQAHSYDGCEDGPPGDRPSFDWTIDDLWRSRKMLVSFDKVGYSRPIVNESIREPGQIYEFDAGKIYWKGAWVLHMLRHRLGDERFFAAVRSYLSRHRLGSVQTPDLIAAFQSPAGHDDEIAAMGGIAGFGVREFFDQWVYRAGMPRLAVAVTQGNNGDAVINVHQKQTINTENPPFRFPLDVVLRNHGGEKQVTLPISEELHEFRIPCGDGPDFVCFDPSLGLYATIALQSKPASMWLNQLQFGPTAYSRAEAIEFARAHKSEFEDHESELAEALLSRLTDESEFWGVRRRAAEALDDLNTEASRAVLHRVNPAEIRNPRVRRAVEAARK